MAAITKIEFWSDVGFIDGAVEIPRLAAVDPTDPDMVIEPDDPIMPSKDRFFTELKLKEYYTGLLTMSYMRITYDLKNSLGIDTPKVFYGWIDKVDLSSDGEYPMTIISWHIDEWRTWKYAISFGSGHVKRRPYRDLGTTPYQNYQIRYERLSPNDASDSVSLFDTFEVGTDKIWWIIFSWNRNRGSDTEINYGYFPVSINHSYNNFQLKSGSDECGTLSLDWVYNGVFDERLGIAPEALNGVWISPISPKVFSGSGTAADPFTSDSLYLVEYQGLGYYFGFFNLTNPTILHRTVTLNPHLTTSEDAKYVIADMVGNKVMDLPYGMEISEVRLTFVFEPTKPYLEISLMNDSNGSMIGCVENVTFPLIPVNSNAYSSYVYGGQQEYDREMRQTRSNAQLWKSTFGGGTQGAMIGAFGPMGALAGAGLGASSGLLNYGVETFYQNDEEQKLENRLRANQPAAMIMDADALMAIERNYTWKIHKIVPDEYSSTQITNTRSQFGISVDELMSSCDTLIRSTSPTGYYNIQNMIVNGNVPVSAKKWIREKFRSGVRLI